jgi:phospholipid transport system substrate-binding protein
MRPSYLSLGRIALLLIMLAAPDLRAETVTGATRFIDDRANTVIKIFSDPKLSPDQRENRLHTLTVQSFDIPKIAKFVLGRHWAAITPAERDQFTKVFEHYMVHVYASRFNRYHDAIVKMTGERPQSSDRIVVRSEIAWHGSDQPAKVDWWVKEAGGSYKIVDVNIEGVSQLLTLRDEFAAVIQQHDGQVSALVEHLKEKIGE